MKTLAGLVPGTAQSQSVAIPVHRTVKFALSADTLFVQGIHRFVLDNCIHSRFFCDVSYT